MPYLTFLEFQTLTGSELDEATFNKYLPKASDIIDSVTRAFFQFHDLETAHTFIKTQFKKAVAYQIEYFNSKGSSSLSEVSNSTSVTIGRTSLSNGSSNSSSDTLFEGLISSDVLLYLRATGLLYRGVASCRC